jgi:hypothetical protein
MQLDFFEKPRREKEKTKPAQRLEPSHPKLADGPDSVYQKPKPYTVIKQGYTTTIWHEEVRNSE